LSIKLRIGAIDPDGRATALATFARLSIDRFQIAPVSRTDFTAAARFADRYELGLRAADALHLAVSAGLGTTLCTLDRRLADAGPALGVPTVLV
jgi:predicted nucleic acid-binding protein